MLAHAYASSSCIEACSPTSEFHVRSFTAPVSAATTTSAAIYQPIPTPYGVSSPRQADRLPRVIRVTLTAYIPWIYVPTFRMVSGFECCGPLAQMRPPLSAGCSSDRSFAYSFLQIPPRGGHPCCSASSSHHQGLQGTFTLKSTKMPPQHLRLRLRATRHAWRTIIKPPALPGVLTNSFCIAATVFAPGTIEALVKLALGSLNLWTVPLATLG